MPATVTFDPAGKVAVVTGGASGIGRGIARALVAAGTDVAIADINTTRLGEATAELAESGRRVLGVVCDVTSDDDVARLAATVREELGPVDLLVNNAGVLVRGLPERLPVEQWRRVLDVNVMGMVHGLSHFLPEMVERGSGYVVNTASMSGLHAYSVDRLPYLSSKYAVVGASEGLALYLPSRGVGVSCVCPGPTATNIRESQVVIDPDTIDGVVGRGQFSAMERQDADSVGALVVSAIRAGRFLILTHPEEAEDAIRRRGESIEDYVTSMRAALDEVAAAGPAASS